MVQRRRSKEFLFRECRAAEVLLGGMLRHSTRFARSKVRNRYSRDFDEYLAEHGCMSLPLSI